MTMTFKDTRYVARAAPRAVRAGQSATGPVDIGANVRRIRKQQAYSLDTLAKKSGVSRAMLGQIETGKSVPTITLVWKIADALGVSVPALIAVPSATSSVILARENARLMTTSNGAFALRVIAAPDFDFAAEVFELRIAPGHRERIEPYPAGTRANLIITEGALEISELGGSAARLRAGDAILFQADVAQEISNSGPGDAKGYLVLAPARNQVRGR